MKKSLLKITEVLFISLFIFTACQSNKTPKNKKKPDAPAVENSPETVSDNINSDEVSLINETADNSEKENQTQNETSLDDELDELEEIEEPLVIDFFPSYEEENLIENKNDSEKQENILEEKIDEFETLTPVEEKHEIPQIENKDSTNTIAQNNDLQGQGPQIQTYTDKNNQKTDSDAATNTNAAGEENIPEVSELEDLENSEAFEEIIEPSRKTTVNKDEYIDITYPGLDWKFYGATDNSKDITLIERKQSKTGTKFTLLAKNPGTKLLRFYKKDILTGSYIDDYIEVTVNDDSQDNVIEVNSELETKTQTPAKNVKSSKPEAKHTDSGKYKSIANPKKLVPKKQPEPADSKNDVNAEQNAESNTNPEQNAEQNAKSPVSENNNLQNPQKQDSKNVQNVNKEEKEPVSQQSQKVQKVQKVQKAEPQNQEQPPVNATVDASSILDEAKKLFEQKKYKESLEKVLEFLGISKDRKDEALYLQGQLYESSSEIKNIKKSLNAYETLIKNYPSSKFWDNANKRIIYLKRFYMEGR